MSTENSWERACRERARDEAMQDAKSQWDVVSGEFAPFPYRWEHVQQVVIHAEWLLSQVGADAEVVIAAAWLHDVFKRESNHAQKGAEFAREFLPTTDFPEDKIEAVAQAIAVHAGLTRPADDWKEKSGEPFRPAPPMEPIEAALLWDADKLTKVGPLSVLHYIPYALAEALRQGYSLSTQDFYEENREWIANVGSRIVASFNTEAAQRRAQRLQAVYETFQDALEDVIALSDEEPRS